MLVRATKVGLVIGVVLVVVAAFSMYKGSSTAPTCDGRQMSATDRCITHYADGHTVTEDYTQAKHYDAGLAWVLLIAGLAVGAASAAGWQQRRRGYRLGVGQA
ncbi:hypothetical protein ABH926_007568 [Catenulispora sp. GP43]|uniref:hypothetical protein n=1 Tax=Catenulispora sp. GP43 TaxID=3156263 RepID=UPI0035110B7A